MRRLLTICACTFFSTTSLAADNAFTGVFHGEGRSCYGALYLREKTIEWHAGWNACERSPYKILNESETKDGMDQYLFQIEKPTKKCLTPIIEMTLYSLEPSEIWSVKGYRSLKDYNNPNLPAQEVYECGLTDYQE